jgi:anaerobic magnesium-protoporphyrin IX monomethyl ester cyclase
MLANKQLDCCFLITSNSAKSYQSLAKEYSAIEPPTWALLLAQSMRSVGYNVNIIDANAENLSEQEIFERLNDYRPRLISFVVYGQNVNAGTTNMSGATHVAKYLKKKNIKSPISFIGSHVQALPKQTLLDENEIDFVFTNEAVYSLRNILKLNTIDLNSIRDIKGIAYRNGNEIIINPPEQIVPNEKMDVDLPGYAWDLLPYKKTPLDIYRSPMWHAEYDFEKRSPYASIQTSLGCQFKCNFCMINLINRNNADEVGVASNYSGMRFWSPSFIIKEFDKLISMGVQTIRIVDEMFLLNPKYYLPLCEMLAERNKNDTLRMWSYSRIDTVRRPDILDVVRKAGIKWLCLGIESGDKKVRLEVAKGKFEDVDVKDVIKKIHNADINVMANYIFGLPGDTKETIKKTFDLSKELCTAGWNTYAAMALPGSQLYKDAIEKGIKLPENYEGYSFHSFETVPLPTDTLTAADILKMRDQAYETYHNYKPFLKLIEERFGLVAAKNIIEMSKIKLKRKICGDTL